MYAGSRPICRSSCKFALHAPPSQNATVMTLHLRCISDFPDPLSATSWISVFTRTSFLTMVDRSEKSERKVKEQEEAGLEKMPIGTGSWFPPSCVCVHLVKESCANMSILLVVL